MARGYNRSALMEPSIKREESPQGRADKAFLARAMQLEGVLGVQTEASPGGMRRFAVIVKRMDRAAENRVYDLVSEIHREFPDAALDVYTSWPSEIEQAPPPRFSAEALH